MKNPIRESIVTFILYNLHDYEKLFEKHPKAREKLISTIYALLSDTHIVEHIKNKEFGGNITISSKLVLSIECIRRIVDLERLLIIKDLQKLYDYGITVNEMKLIIEQKRLPLKRTLQFMDPHRPQYDQDKRRRLGYSIVLSRITDSNVGEEFPQIISLMPRSIQDIIAKEIGEELDILNATQELFQHGHTETEVISILSSRFGKPITVSRLQSILNFAHEITVEIRLGPDRAARNSELADLREFLQERGITNMTDLLGLISAGMPVFNIHREVIRRIPVDPFTTMYLQNLCAEVFASTP